MVPEGDLPRAFVFWWFYLVCRFYKISNKILRKLYIECVFG